MDRSTERDPRRPVPCTSSATRVRVPGGVYGVTPVTSGMHDMPCTAVHYKKMKQVYTQAYLTDDESKAWFCVNLV